MTFVGGYFASELNTVSFLGFPLGFCLFAQGRAVGYLVIIVIYVLAMNRLDRRYRFNSRH